MEVEVILLFSERVRVLEFNYRCRRGEIDIIMLDDDCIVFVEVRYRKRNTHGTPLETVNHRKQEKLIIAAKHYIQDHHYENHLCRFDVIAAQSDYLGELHFDWIKNAFSP